MGQRGPAPTPTPILDARGSWRAKGRDGEVQLPVKAPTCPAFLPDEAKDEWKRQCALLPQMGVLAEVDRAALAACWGGLDLASISNLAALVQTIKRTVEACNEF